MLWLNKYSFIAMAVHKLSSYISQSCTLDRKLNHQLKTNHQHHNNSPCQSSPWMNSSQTSHHGACRQQSLAGVSSGANMGEGGAEKYKYKITVIVTAFIMVCYVFQTRIAVKSLVYSHHENRVNIFSNRPKFESMKRLKSLSCSEFLKLEDIRSPSSFFINVGMIVINNKIK